MWLQCGRPKFGSKRFTSASCREGKLGICYLLEKKSYTGYHGFANNSFVDFPMPVIPQEPEMATLFTLTLEGITKNGICILSSNIEDTCTLVAIVLVAKTSLFIIPSEIDRSSYFYFIS